MLLPWQGQPLIRHVVRTALASRLDGLVVVVGHLHDTVVDALRDLPARHIYNPAYQAGMSSSLRVGLEAVPANAGAALIMLGDQPLVTMELIDRILGRYWTTRARIVAPFADRKRGNPVLFDRALFPALLTLSGDEGARAVIEAHRDTLERVEVDAAVFEDVDTPEAYARLSSLHSTT